MTTERKNIFKGFIELLFETNVMFKKLESVIKITGSCGKLDIKALFNYCDRVGYSYYVGSDGLLTIEYQ